MFGKTGLLRGLARLEVRGHIPESFLNGCAARGLEIISVRRVDGVTLELIMPLSALKELESVAVKSFCSVKVLSRGRAWGRLIARRIFPMLLALCLVGLLFWSKFYVWEIEIQGNSSVPAGRILDVLSDCGVENGAFWPGFSADNIRSQVLYHIPELSWISVNIHGSLAEVIVVERKEKPEMVFEGESASIVADKDAFIRKVDALTGQAEVKAGDAVSKGDVLISGAVESTYAPPRFLRSYGFVEAETNTEYLAVTPEEEAIRRYTGDDKTRFALIIGNNRINFYSGSSISDAFCDKIISVWDLEIPGLFRLPVSLVRESFAYYETESAKAEEYEAGERLRLRLHEALDRDMGEGELISDKLSFYKQKGLITASLRVRCREEIGVLRPISEAEKAEAERKFTEKADDQ